MVQFIFIYYYSGIEEAKSKVLGVVHELAVKDIRQFIDWMKTFQVEKIKEGKKLLCLQVWVGDITVT